MPTPTLQSGGHSRVKRYFAWKKTGTPAAGDIEMIKRRGGGEGLEFGDGDGDVAVADDAVVVALEEEGAGFGFVAIEGAAGGSGDFDVVVVHFAVAEDGDAATDEGDIEGRPFAEVDGRVGGRGVVAVDGAHFMVGEFAAFGADLDFVAAAEVDAAVAVVGAVDFNVEFEVLELFDGFDVGGGGATFAVDHGIIVDEFAVAGDPFVVGDVGDGFPAGEVFAVEDGAGFGPGLGHGAVKLGGADGGEGGAVFGAAFFVAGVGVGGGGGEFPGEGGSEGEGEFGTVDFRAEDGLPAAAAGLDAALDLAVFFDEFHPLGVGFAGGGGGVEVPAAEEGFHVLRRGGESEGKGEDEFHPFHCIAVGGGCSRSLDL